MKTIIYTIEGFKGYDRPEGGEYSNQVASAKANALLIENPDILFPLGLPKVLKVGDTFPLPDNLEWEIVTVMSPGWQPTYSNPDNSGCEQPSEPMEVLRLKRKEDKPLTKLIHAECDKEIASLRSQLEEKEKEIEMRNNYYEEKLQVYHRVREENYKEIESLQSELSKAKAHNARLVEALEAIRKSNRFRKSRGFSLTKYSLIPVSHE